MWKKMRPKSVVLQSWKKLQVLEKKSFRKKIFQHVCAYIIFKTVCRNFLKINASRDIYVSVILKYRKMVLHNKISNETWPIKNQENSVQHFVENYLTNHLAKFLQDRIKPWRVGALRVFFFNWDSLHARLNSHYEAWSYKKRSTKKRLQDTENLFRKNLQLKDVCSFWT